MPTDGTLSKIVSKRRRAGSFVLRRPEAIHRLDEPLENTWSLFITGPRVRGWGFHTKAGFVPFNEYHE